MIEFINFPPKEPGDVVLTQETHDVIQVALDWKSANKLPALRLHAYNPTDDVYRSGVEIGKTIFRSIEKGSDQDKDRLTRELAVAALRGSFENIKGDIVGSYMGGVQRAVENITMGYYEQVNYDG